MTISSALMEKGGSVKGGEERTGNAPVLYTSLLGPAERKRPCAAKQNLTVPLPKRVTVQQTPSGIIQPACRASKAAVK